METTAKVSDLMKANTYLARSIDGIRNGSLFRVTGRKRRNRFAHYINGDFVGFVNELPAPASDFKSWTRREAKRDLPRCMQ
jgi:hypothetical protein